MTGNSARPRWLLFLLVWGVGIFPQAIFWAFGKLSLLLLILGVLVSGISTFLAVLWLTSHTDEQVAEPAGHSERDLAEQNWESEALVLVSRATELVNEPDHLYRWLTEQLAKILQAERSVLLLRNHDEDGLSYRAVTPAYGFSSAEIESLGTSLESAGSSPSIVRKTMIRQQGDSDEPLGLLAGERNMMSVPMFVGGSSVGAIRLSNKQAGFGVHDVQTLSMMADRLAALLEHGQLFHALQARHSEITMLYRISVPRSSSLDFDGAVSESVDAVQSLLEGEEVNLFLVDESGEMLRLVGSSVLHNPETQSVSISLDRGIIGQVAATGESTLVDHQEARVSSLAQHTRVRSELCVPLKLGSWVIGVVHAQSGRPGAFEQTQLTLLEIIAGQLASHLQSARLYEATRQRATELSSLYEATVAMSRAELDRSGIAELVIERMIDAISADGGHLGLWNAITNTVETRLALGLTIADSNSSDLPDRPLTELLWKSLLANRHPLALYENDPQLEPSLLAAMQKAGIRSALILPLVTHDRMTGLVELTKNTPHRFSQGEIRLSLTLATQAAIVMENARLFQETKLAVEELAALQALALDITAQVTLPELLERLMMRARHLVRASGSIIYLGGRQGDLLDAVACDLPWPDNTISISQRGQGLAQEVIESGRTLVRTLNGPSVSVDRDASSVTSQEPLALHSAAVPLRWRERVVGVLIVFRDMEEQPFSGQQVYLLELLAPQAAIAIRNVQLYEALEQGMKDLEEAQSNLVQAEKAAAIGRLTASLAHEINNPLQSLNNCLHLSLRPELATEKKELYLSLAQDEMERLIEIVNRMLNFYRPAAAETRSETSINRLLADVLALVSKQLEHRKVVVELDLDPDLPDILAIANNLLQVFMNLILNAVDAMPDGGRLTVATDLIEGDCVKVTITDTGRGIAPEVIPMIYEPFFTTKENGTGLGLSITYGIIEAHDGEIGVESTMDVGTTFSIVLPVGLLDGE